MVKQLKQNRINNIIDNYLSNMIYENKLDYGAPHIDFYYHKVYPRHYSIFVNNKDKRITIITSLMIETYPTYQNCPITIHINNKFGTADYEVQFIEHFIY